MDIVFSRHALYQLKERHLSKTDVRNTLVRPLKTTVQPSTRYRAVKTVSKKGRKYLMVVIYDQRNLTQEVVTAFLTSKFKKYL